MKNENYKINSNVKRSTFSYQKDSRESLHVNYITLLTMRKDLSFPLRISSVNGTKS